MGREFRGGRGRGGGGRGGGNFRGGRPGGGFQNFGPPDHLIGNIFISNILYIYII